MTMPIQNALSSSPTNIDADVVVIGAGTAGTIAAIQAGRLGARTVLVEAGNQVGGTTTIGGVDFPGLFHAWGQQVIAGIGWNLVEHSVAFNGDTLPDFSIPFGKNHPQHHVKVNSSIYALLAEEACVQAGVQLRYYESPSCIDQTPQGWRLELVGKGTSIALTAKQVVDCTGNAAVVDLCGLPRQREATTQPGTLIFRLDGYDINRIDLKALQLATEAALQTGELGPTDFHQQYGIRHFLYCRGCNAMHVLGADSSTSAVHTQANLLGRQGLLRMLRFLKRQPGFADLRLTSMAAETSIRETYRIVGESTITVEDYVTGRLFPDALAYSFYPIDLHDEHGVQPEHLREGKVPTIPRGALIPQGSRNLLVAGRCLSSDRLANSALRVQASCMAMGQAAGAAAALAVQSDTTPGQVPLADLRRCLVEHGAIVPPLEIGSSKKTPLR